MRKTHLKRLTGHLWLKVKVCQPRVSAAFILPRILQQNEWVCKITPMHPGRITDVSREGQQTTMPIREENLFQGCGTPCQVVPGTFSKFARQKFPKCSAKPQKERAFPENFRNSCGKHFQFFFFRNFCGKNFKNVPFSKFWRFFFPKWPFPSQRFLAWRWGLIAESSREVQRLISQSAPLRQKRTTRLPGKDQVSISDWAQIPSLRAGNAFS